MREELTPCAGLRLGGERHASGNARRSTTLRVLNPVHL